MKFGTILLSLLGTAAITFAAEVVTEKYAIPLKQDQPNQAFGPQNTGTASKSNGAHQINSLVSFDLPGYTGKQCQLRFRNAKTSTGSRQVQVFTIPGTFDPNLVTFNSRPYRDRHVATFSNVLVAPGGLAAAEYFGGPTFDCPSIASTLTFEVVPTGDNDEVTWNTNNRGLIINVTP